MLFCKGNITIYDILSIYSGYPWHDNAHGTADRMIKPRSGLHTRKTPQSTAWRASYGVFYVSNTKKNDSYISRAHCICISYEFLTVLDSIFATENITRLNYIPWKFVGKYCQRWATVRSYFSVLLTQYNRPRTTVLFYDLRPHNLSIRNASQV